MKKSVLAACLYALTAQLCAQNIGIGTSDPQAKLHVETGFTGEAIRLTSEFGSHISFRLSGGVSPAAPLIGFSIANPVEPDFRMSTPAGSNYPIKFYTNDNLRMTVAGNGNVGIGNNGNPQATIHINSASSEAVRVQGPFAYQTFYNNNNYMGFIQAWTDGIGIGSTTGNAIRFYTNNGNQRMAILPDGNVGIGNTNPAYNLDVSGDVNINGALRTNGLPGTAGQILVSTGASGVQWRNNSFSNNIRFAASFSCNNPANASPSYFFTPQYNLSPSDITISTNSLTINKSGLYHIEGAVKTRGNFNLNPSFVYISVFVNYGASIGLPCAEIEPMRFEPNSFPYYYYSKLTRFSHDIYLSAPATISIQTSFGADAGILTSASSNGWIWGHLISE